MEHEGNEVQGSEVVKHEDNADVAVEADKPKLSRSELIRRELPKVGFYFSAAYLVFLALMAVVAWDKLFVMGPNEFGDMLAGCFAPLAFLWLVLGFFQQGEELQASVRALELQGEELRNSVEQQRELVKVSREQMESEITALAEQRSAAEHAAQPTLVPVGGGSYSGKSASFRIGFTNAGADATQVYLWIADKRIVESAVLSKVKQSKPRFISRKLQT